MCACGASGLFAKEYLFGGKNGWPVFMQQEGITTGKGRYGYDCIELASNSFVFDEYTDLLIDFEDADMPISDGDYIKIGIAENIDSRIKGLQIGNARRLMLVEYIWFNSKSAALWAERELHEMYKNKRVLGEWFDIGFDYDFLALISEIRHGPPVCYMDIKTEYNEFMNDRRLSVLRGG